MDYRSIEGLRRGWMELPSLEDTYSDSELRVFGDRILLIDTECHSLCTLNVSELFDSSMDTDTAFSLIRRKRWQTLKISAANTRCVVGLRNRLYVFGEKKTIECYDMSYDKCITDESLLPHEPPMDDPIAAVVWRDSIVLMYHHSKDITETVIFSRCDFGGPSHQPQWSSDALPSCNLQNAYSMMVVSGRLLCSRWRGAMIYDEYNHSWCRLRENYVCSHFETAL